MRNFILSISLLTVAFIAPWCANAQWNYSSVKASISTGTYTDLGTNGSAISTSNNDDANSSSQSIGFSFPYNGSTFTDFVLNTNGFIVLGVDTPSSRKIYNSPMNTISGGASSTTNSMNDNLIFPFNMDLEGTANAEYRVYTTGTSPNQTCTIQFEGLKDKNGASGGNNAQTVQYNSLEFQIVLHEDGTIDFIYGTYTASNAAANFKSADVGIRGTAANTADMITITKTSATNWDAATIQDGQYAGNAFNNRNNFLPTSGVTYTFVPLKANDLAANIIYTFGKLPQTFGAPEYPFGIVSNIGTDTAFGAWIYLAIEGDNSFLDSVQLDTMLPQTAYYAVFQSGFNPANLGIDSAYIYVPSDDNNSNNTSNYYHQEVTQNVYNYAEPGFNPTNGVGFTGATGDFVARFVSNQQASVNQLSVNFYQGNQKLKVGIWDTDPNTGDPNTLLWSSASFTTTQGLSVIAVNPPVSVNGSFFVGVIQTGTTNASFGFQDEAPIRPLSFYFTSPTGSSTWTDFSSVGADFRLMIEPRMQLPNDVGVIKLTTPTNDSCIGGTNTTVTFQIQNLGTNTIDFTTDPVTVIGEVTDPSSNVTTFSPVTINTGTLASNDTLDVVVSTTYDMSLYGDHIFRAWTEWGLDVNPVNDTLPSVTRTASNPSGYILALGNTTICQGDSVAISGSNNNGLFYQWMLNGSPIKNATDTVFYASASGDYTQVITNATNCSVTTNVVTITVNPLPSAAITAPFAGFCPGGSVDLSAPNVSGNTYQWYYNGSAINGATSDTYTASQAGDYTVEVTSAAGCKATSSKFTITQFTNPDASITANGATTFCAGGSVTLNGVAANGASYQWMLNGNPINGATSVSYSATASGDYTLMVTTNGCSSTSTSAISVTVNPAPSVAITPSGSVEVCDGSTLKLDAGTGNGWTYQWMLNGNAINGATSQTYDAGTAGDYTVMVTDASGCSGTSSATTVAVNPLPQTTITPSGSTTFCSGGSVTLLVNSGYASYQWMLNGSAISGATSNFYVANATGDYSVTITTDKGCSATSSATTVTVNAVPTATATPAGATSVCEGNTVVLNATTGQGSYQWKKDGVDITGATSDSYTANTSGVYTVTVSNGTCSSTSAGVTVTINPNPPVPTITQAGNIFTSSASTGNQWYLNGTAITGATGNSYAASQNGDYQVEVTDANGCKSISAKLTYVSNGLIQASTNITGFNVFPNPSTGVFNLKLSLLTGKRLTITLTDLTGKTIKSWNELPQGDSFQKTMDLSDLSNGMYLITVSCGDQQVVSRITKQ